MFQKLGLAITLFIFWLLLSGIYQPLIISFGIASSLLVAWIAHRMDVIDHEGFPIHLGTKAVTYWPWLIWEIIKANIDVAAIIIKPKLPITPTMFSSHASQKTEVGQVIYANSITLTPGTISVGIADGMVEVHALTSQSADDVITGRMDKRVSQIEGDS